MRLGSPLPLALAGLFAVAAAASIARADAPLFLPYSTRTQSYSGYMTSVRGDIRTVGMAGATIGLADTFIAAGDNPAGLAMSLKEVDTNFARNEVTDEQVQDPSSPVVYSNIGAAASIHPWGFSLGYAAPYREEQLDSRTASLPDDPTHLLVTTREFRLGAARLFARDRLSVGVSVSIMQAAREIEYGNHPELSSRSKTLNYNVTLGAMYRTPGRILYGVSFTPSARYVDDNPDTPSHGIGSFFQPIEVPARFGAGVGWVPNRFFRLGGTLWVVGRTPNTALLKNEAYRVGTDLTLQPRMGTAYVFIDYKELQGTVFAGSYLEMTRIDGFSNRYHATGGLEAKVWAIGAGFGFDVSAGYRNSLFSIGVDVVRLAEKLDLIPKLKKPAYGGFLPAPLIKSEDGLAHGLSDHWDESASGNDPIQIVKDIPKRLTETPGNLYRSVIRAAQPLAPKPKAAKPKPVPPSKPSTGKPRLAPSADPAPPPSATPSPTASP